MSRRYNWRLGAAAAAFTGVAAVYLVFRSAYYFPDGLRWELYIAAEGARAVWHPHRLAYNGLALAFFAFLKFLGWGGRLFGAMQILDAFVGAGGVVLFYFILRGAKVEFGAALAGALALAFSFGYWAFSCNAENVILAAVVAFAAFYFLQRAVRTGAPFGLWLVAAAVGGAAALAHISNAVLLFTVLAAYIVTRRGRTLLRLPLVVGSFFAVPLAAYGAAAFVVLGCRNAGDAWLWFFGVPGRTAYYTTVRLRNLAMDLFALGRDFFAVRWYKDVAAGGWTADKILTAALLGAAGGALVAAFVWAASLYIRNKTGRKAAYLALALFLPFAAFFTFRDAGAWDRWLVQAGAVIYFIYAGLGAGAPRRAAKGLLYALPALLFVGNFVGGVWPESRLENNEHLAFTRYVGRLAGPGDLAVFSGVGGLGQGIYVNYFAGVDTAYIYFGARDPAAFRTEIDARLAAGRLVIVGDDRAVASALELVSPGDQTRYSVTGTVARELFAPYTMTPLAVYRGPKYKPSPFWRLERK